jgi:hypothetical protein
MTTNAYRYLFQDAIPAEEIEATLLLSIFTVEALHGESQTRLDAGHAFDAKKRAVVIDASTAVGQALNRIFIGLVAREFGSGSFRVERIQQKPRPEAVTA